jgi:hypothetical protein
MVHETLSQKYPTQNRSGVVAQVVENLLSKCKKSSNPNSTKKRSALPIFM